jgi:hypothetical protein
MKNGKNEKKKPTWNVTSQMQSLEKSLTLVPLVPFNVCALI